MATTQIIHKPCIDGKHKTRCTWEKVIDYLQTELRRTTRQQRIQQIQSAIATFKANVERGVPWPGTHYRN
jgi:hypothetical protein